MEKIGFDNVPPRKNEEHLLGLTTAMSYHDYDLVNYDIRELIFVQFVKSIEYFLCSNSHCPEKSCF